jgi:RNA polymerase sigma factor for flagellar operon FliA
LAPTWKGEAMNEPRPDPQQLIEECQGLVRSLAVAIRRKLPPNVDLEDLVAYGQIGLVEAARDFDPARGGRFSTYAYYRIRGAIYDGLSKMTWFGRRDQAQVRYHRGSNELLRLEEEEAGTSPETGLTVDARWLRNVTRALAVVYLATQVDAEEGPGVGALEDRSSPAAPAVAIGREISQRLHELVDALPPEASQLIRSTYFEGLTLQEAGARLGVSKSWASRLHAKALQRLARSLRLEGITV